MSSKSEMIESSSDDDDNENEDEKALDSDHGFGQGSDQDIPTYRQWTIGWEWSVDMVEIPNERDLRGVIDYYFNNMNNSNWNVTIVDAQIDDNIHIVVNIQSEDEGLNENTIQQIIKNLCFAEYHIDNVPVRVTLNADSSEEHIDNASTRTGGNSDIDMDCDYNSILNHDFSQESDENNQNNTKYRKWIIQWDIEQESVEEEQDENNLFEAILPYFGEDVTILDTQIDDKQDQWHFIVNIESENKALNEQKIQKKIQKIVRDKYGIDDNIVVDVKYLRYYQNDAVESLLKGNKSRMQCIMPCGTGKTIVILHYVFKIINDSESIQTKRKILLLLPSLQLINQIYQSFVDYFGRAQTTLCLCSQMDSITLTQKEHKNDKNANEILAEFIKISKDVPYTTDINEINSFFSSNNNENLFVFSTYQSSHLLNGRTFDIAIFDEAHKTTNECYGKTLKDDFTQIAQRIFFTATPKHYKYRKHKKKKNKNDFKVIAMNNATLYGRMEYEYTFQRAIKDKFILDYQLFLCYFYDHDNKSKDYVDLLQQKFIGPDQLMVDDHNMLLSALMLAKSIKTNNNKIKKISKILTYHNTIKNADKFRKLLEYAFKKCSINKSYKIWMMSGKMKISKRKEIFEKFEDSEIGIICSSRVLNEGVDLPFVDTIMFVEPRRSTIDIVQCIGRGLRLHHKLKKCNVLLPIYYDKLTESSTFQCVLEILIAMIGYDKSLIQEFIPKSIKNKNDEDPDVVMMEKHVENDEDDGNDGDYKKDEVDGDRVIIFGW